MNYCDRIYADKDCNTIVDDKLERDSFEGFAYVYILQRNRYDKTKSNQVIIKEKPEDEVVFTINEDGFYTLCTIKISTKESSKYRYVNKKFYEGTNEIELQKIIDINPETTKVEIDYQQYFQTCWLRKCFINYCQQIFDLRLNLRCVSKDIDQDLIYRRDLVWAALNVIKYMTECDQYEEAERLLQRITSCNGLCEQVNSNKGCGCGKRNTGCNCQSVRL